MKKTTGVAIGTGIMVAIIIGIIVAIFPSESNVSSDSPEITENVVLNESGPGSDSVAINETYSMNKGVDFYINEEGKKTYVIKANDSPDLGD